MSRLKGGPFLAQPPSLELRSGGTCFLAASYRERPTGYDSWMKLSRASYEYSCPLSAEPPCLVLPKDARIGEAQDEGYEGDGEGGGGACNGAGQVGDQASESHTTVRDP